MITLGEQAEQALRAVREASKIAYDTETSGLDWQHNHAVGYVITVSPEANWYIPVRHGGGGNLMDPHCGPLTAPDAPTVTHSFERELAKAFEARRARGFLTVGHNLLFDMLAGAEHGIRIGRNCEDTQINEAMLDEFSRSFSLDNCARKHGVTEKKGDELYAHLAKMFGGEAKRDQMEHFWRLAGTDPIGVDYALGDGVSTLELRESQIVQIREQEMEQIHRVESRLIWTLFRMKYRGMRAEPDRIGAVSDEIKRRLAIAEAKLPPRFNTRSPSDVRKLMEGAGHTDWPMTAPSSRFPEGQPSFPEKWLKRHDEGKAVIEVRKLTNLSNSFVTPLAERHVFKGRVHSTLNQLKADDYGTISGRFSSSQPNMQQVPKRDKDLGRLFRGIFRPDDGMVFYEADYSQCEPRLFAHYSQEPSLLAGYNAQPFRDMHDVVAQMFEVERDPTAKRMNMGILTGMQAKTFASHMDWPLDKASREFNRWFEFFPGIKEFQLKAKGAFKRRGYVRTLLGRRCRLDSVQFAYKAVSRIIQGSNADILKYKLLEADEYLEDNGLDHLLQLLMTVHDSFEFQAEDSPEGEALAAFIIGMWSAVQCEPFNLRVPFVMDVGKGETWAIATYGEPK